MPPQIHTLIESLCYEDEDAMMQLQVHMELLCKLKGEVGDSIEDASMSIINDETFSEEYQEILEKWFEGRVTEVNE